MDAGVVGARIASGVVAPLVRKLFVTESAGAGLVEAPVRVSGLVSFTGEKRTLTERDLEKLAAELVRRAVRDIGPHEAPSPGETERAVQRLARTLHALGDIGLSDVEAVHLGHTDFARALHAQATTSHPDPHPPHLDPTPGEAALYHRVLDTACLHILHFFTQRSTFVARTLVEQSRQLGELITLVDVLIERIPSQSARDAEFEQRYARYIANKHCKLTIYGIDLQQASEWPLDTAYLSLEAAPSAEPPAADDPTWQAAAEAQPVDQALSGHRRILLRGIAGSGKTTLVQWLAVTTARQAELTGRLAHLIGRVPFVLPLRSLTRAGAELPLPAGFLAAVGCPLSGSQPPGWVDRVLTAGRGVLLIDGIDEVPEEERERTRRWLRDLLTAGRGVLLIDGIDEVPEEERERTRRWLRDLLTAFPGNLVLVTSRPSAVREDWLGHEEFTELSLSPMRPADVEVFIHRWHTAAEAGGELEEDLRAAVRAKPDLGRLATNPLMCGLVCALHRERRGFLPRGRKALYDAALGMLLERRDRERAMHTHPGAIELDEESQIELLQKLAYWLIRNGRSELAHEDALDLLGRVLPSMPYAAAQGSAEEIFRHLLVRSGLLREPAHGAVEFVHRTFQDYLGAKAAVEERDFDLLARHAHLDQWEDVIRMAVAHARPDERARLLHRLIERGDTEPGVRTRLHLLAMACLEHATKLDPAVREEVEDRGRELIPPQSIDEAKALVPMGPVVLELLSEVTDLTDSEAMAVAHTAAQMGTDAALALLTRFRGHHSPGVLQQLAGHWDRFDAGKYAKEIIRYLADLPTVQVTASTSEHLACLRRMDERLCSRVRGELPPDEIIAAQGTGTRLRRLNLAYNPGLTRLDFVSAFPRLTDLDIRECPVTDLAPLGELPLETLYLWDVPALEDLRGIEALTGLTWLGLREGTRWPGVQRLAALTSLSTLLLPYDTAEFEGISRLPNLETLNVYRVKEEIGASSWAELAGLPRFRELTCEPHHLTRLAASGVVLPRLTRLHLVLDGKEADLRQLARCAPELETLQISTAPSGISLAPLAGLPRMHEVSLQRAAGEAEAIGLPSHISLHYIGHPARKLRPRTA